MKMSGLEENIKELIVLSDLMLNQDFRICFVTHLTNKVTELGSFSSKMDVNIRQRLQLKLLQPLMFHLKTTSNSSDKCVLIQCVIQVLKITVINSVNVFFDIYTMTFFQIFKSGSLSYEPSEELKECVLDCCSFLMKNSTRNLLEKVYTQEFGAKFSLGIYISVNIVKEEKSIKLRLAALNFLLVASNFENQLKYNNEIFGKIGDLFMLYLPGILGPLLEVILRNETQHHLITTNALTYWGHILCLVMRDFDKSETLTDCEIVKQWLVNQKENYQENVIDVSNGLKEKERTELWLKSAAVTLHPLILKLSDLRKHSHPRCRLELISVMVKLLKNCTRNLRMCLPVIIEVLVSSAVDEDKEVSQVAEEALNEFDIECNTVLLAVLEENLYSAINRLPRVLQSGNEDSLLLSLKSLSGYLRSLGRQNRLKHLISLSSTLKKLIFCLKISFELEVYPEISNQDFSVWDNEVDSVWCKPWKRFRHFTSKSIKNQLEEICHNLGNFGHSETIFDFLLEIYEEDHLFRKEILLILNELILGSKEIEDHLISQLLDFYLNPEHLSLPLQVNDIDYIDLKEAQTNIIKVALTMEGIANLANKTEKRFKEYLLKSLYDVLRRAGSSFSIIRQSAIKTAVEIANSCGLNGNVKLLIHNNIDYLGYHLTVKLKRNEESALDVITVLIRNSTLQTMPNLEEIINNVLKSSSRNFDSPHTLSYLRLFQIFVACVSKCMKINMAMPLQNVRPESPAERVVKYLEGLQKEETMPEFEEKEETTPEFGEKEGIKQEEEADTEPEKPQLPKHLKLTLDIANHCLHYLASKDKGRKIIVLEILNECVWALAKYENALLPLVHNIWSPLITKFESITEPLIMNRSFTLLCTLSFTSKDFVRARTLKNVLPTLESFLLQQSSKSKLKDSASGYFFTQNFKLQRELLNNLGKLTSSLGLFEKQTDLVMQSALPYLSNLQPRELQEKCRVLFEDLITYDRQLVWYKVHNLAGNSEFAKNAEMILNSVK